MSATATIGARIIAAAENHDLDTLREILKETVDENIIDYQASEYTDTALHAVVLSKMNDPHEETTLAIVDLLLNNGANVNIVGREGQTAVWWAADCDKKKTVELLLDRGADVNLANIDGLTPLYKAVKNNNLES